MLWKVRANIRTSAGPPTGTGAIVVTRPQRARASLQFVYGTRKKLCEQYGTQDCHGSEQQRYARGSPAKSVGRSERLGLIDLSYDASAADLGHMSKAVNYGHIAVVPVEHFGIEPVQAQANRWIAAGTRLMRRGISVGSKKAPFKVREKCFSRST